MWAKGVQLLFRWKLNSNIYNYFLICVMESVVSCIDQTKSMIIQWGMIFTLIVSVVLAISVGAVSISPIDVWHIIMSKLMGQELSVASALADIVWDIRVPRVILASIVGAGLALSGVVMQASVQNPLAEPFILGIASGASVGAVVTILLGSVIVVNGIVIGVPMGAFIGAIVATIGVLLLSGIRSRMSTVRLILAGAVVSALCTAISNFTIYMAGDVEGIQSATFWTMGSLADAKWDGLVLPMTIVSVVTAYFMSQVRILDALLLGEEAAITLGINATKQRRIYMGIIALLTGILVSQCGIIGFVGLVIPHIMRSFVGAVHRHLLPVAVLFGAIFLVWADVLSRVLLASGDLPIGIITALMGAPLFMKLLFGNSQNFGG